jgi:hypothetical protein
MRIFVIAVLFAALVVLSGCARYNSNHETTISDGQELRPSKIVAASDDSNTLGVFEESDGGVGTKYSPDGKFLIEGYDLDFENNTSGLYPVREIRIVEVDSSLVVWKMEGLFLLYQEPQFIWSPDSRYVSVAYGGRIWASALVVDTIDMSQNQLPDLAELTALFPDFPPNNNRPDPYVIPQQWLDEVMIEVKFSWYSDNESIDSEHGQFSGLYVFNVQTGELVDV